MAVTEAISTLVNAWSFGTKKNLSAFSNLETADGEYTLVGKDGSLATVIRIDGIKEVMGDAELSNIIDQMSIKMAPYLRDEGRAIQIWFARDPDLSGQIVNNILRTQRAVANKLNLQFNDVFQERANNLPKHIVWEGFYMTLWTRLDVVTKQEIKNAELLVVKPPIMPVVSNAQNPLNVGKVLNSQHKAFVSSMLGDLNDMNIRASRINTHESLKAIKWSLYPDLVGAEWHPHLPGDPVSERVPEINDVDVSHLLWPRIDDQLFDREAERINPRVIKMGSRFFSSMDMSVGPLITQPFDVLLRRMIELGEFPWRISFILEGNGLKSAGWKRFLAAVFQITNSDNNKQIRKALQDLADYNEEGHTVTKMRISFATWAPVDDTGHGLRLIEERAAKLQQAVQNWGNCGVNMLVGDPVEGTLSSAIALDAASTAPAGAVPLPDAITMLPWNRDASPWSNGSVMLVTADKKAWPYEPGTSLQDTFIDLIFAPPGKGKSVLLCTMNLAMCLSSTAAAIGGGTQLPRIAIIDIGPSQAGLISLLQEALPLGRRHEAAYHRLRMSHAYAINPFDTQLGLRYPMPVERMFLVNFLTALGTEVGETKPPNGLVGILGVAIDALYKKYDDAHRKGQPKRYSPSVDHVVDRAIAQYNIPIDEGKTYWWDIVDALFEHNDYTNAALAQRHAVPKLEDIMAVLKDPQAMDIHLDARTETGERTIQMVLRLISAAVQDYPILQRPTAFDIGNARVVALDLDEIAPKGGGPADKQTALMYMLARHAAARDFYLNPGMINFVPDKYRHHHLPRFKKIRETPKRIVYDELHRTSSSPATRQQLAIDMREGRKNGVQIAVASQLLKDFDREMVDVASGIWILGAQDRAADEAASMFNLSPTATRILKDRLNGPTEKGAPVLLLLSLKEGRHAHWLYNVLGPNELWAFSTGAEDSALRTRLYEILGPVDARSALASRFKSGSAKAEIERRVALELERGGKNIEDVSNGIIEQLVKELAGNKYFQ